MRALYAVDLFDESGKWVTTYYFVMGGFSIEDIKRMALKNAVDDGLATESDVWSWTAKLREG